MQAYYHNTISETDGTPVIGEYAHCYKQFGFNPETSTQMQVLKLMNRWTLEIDQGDELELVVRDFAEAVIETSVQLLIFHYYRTTEWSLESVGFFFWWSKKSLATTLFEQYIFYYSFKVSQFIVLYIRIAIFRKIIIYLTIFGIL